MASGVARKLIAPLPLLLLSACPVFAALELQQERPARPPELESIPESSLSMRFQNKQNLLPQNQLIKLQATYRQSVSLKELLEHVLRYNLPIHISKESWNFQRGQFLASAAGFVPSYSLNYKRTFVTVFPDTRTRSNLFVSELIFPVFAGGEVLFNTLGGFYRDRAWKHAYKSTVNSTLLDAYKKYYELLNQKMLLEIQAISVKISDANLKLIEANYRAGLATQFDIMQARTQLGSDRERLWQQETAARAAARELNMIMNLPMLIDLLPRTQSLKKEQIIDPTLKIQDYENIALIKRPELRQYELFRLAASRSVQTAAASFFPDLTFFTAYTKAGTALNIPDNENALNGVAATEVAEAEENFGVVTNTALDQTASFSPGEQNTAQQGANTLTDVVAGSGGNPIANVQGGSLVTSGAVKPRFNSNVITGVPSTSNIQGSDTASAGIFPGRSRNFQKGMDLSWTLTNLGLSTAGNVLSARSLKRQAMLQANQELILVKKEVRAAYMSYIVARERLKSAGSAREYGKNSLKLARLRLNSGVGNTLELIEAQKQYIGALRKQSEAILALNLAQAELLKSTGLISVDTLTRGLR